MKSNDLLANYNPVVQVAVLTAVLGSVVKAVSMVTFIVHVACYLGLCF